MRCIFSVIFLTIAIGFSTIAQNIPAATTASERLSGFERRKAISGDHVLQNLEFESVGPTIMGGRVADVDVNPDDPNAFFIAYASGGLWYTENNGQSYKSLFDHEMVMTIGDIAVDWANKVIWIGTGENNSSRSSYSGFGVYKSDDWGKTWQHMGLEESHHIGRIILHPENPDIIWVAALGHLYSPNKERGVYKSTDGGSSWNQVLFVGDNTGAIDLVINPKDPDMLYAAMWFRERRAWNFVEGGRQSGIYQSKDGGGNWKLVSGDGSGFAIGDGIGRIGLAITSDGKFIYAILDNQNRRPKKEEEKKGLQRSDFMEMSKDDFGRVNKDEIKEYLTKNGFPKELTVDSISSLIENDVIEAKHLAFYIEDANRDLFETEVTGAEVYASRTDVRYWMRTHDTFLDDLVFTYGYYFGQIRVSPTDNAKIYIVGVPILKSEDGGKTFESINGDNQHVDHHALWVSPEKDGHLINGNDGGINISYDDGENWLKVKSPPVGQFYSVNVDMAKPYKIYGGLQDNGVWMGPSNYKESTSWEGSGRYPYQRIMGGDGFKVEIDSRDNATIYTGFQFGHYYRFTLGGKRTKVSPKHELGERPLRFNWQTPIYLSRHNQDIFYFGSNKFHRSMNKGNSYDLVSADLTKGGKKGDVAFGTITCIHESDVKFGLLYVGTDDGLIYRTDDAGYNWEKITASIPENMWVSSIQASRHDTGRVYMALNGYRWDHFDAYTYMSDDFGKTWNRIGLDLPLEPVNVLREDPKNENILYVGTDNGLYISLNRGESFMYMEKGIPSVAVHDLVIHTRENDLVVGTHGRSIYKTSVKEVQKLSNAILDRGIHLFKIPSVNYSESWGKKYNAWKEERKAEIDLPVYVKEKEHYSLKIKMKDNSLVLYSKIIALEKGINYVSYDLTIDESVKSKYLSALKKVNKNAALKEADDGKLYLKPGIYEITWTGGSGNFKETTTLQVKSREKKK